jgi:uncharacterized protein (TIGR00255 family)
MAQSMTAFSRVLKQSSYGALAIEMKSVNHRYLEVGTRLPEQFRSSEIDFRQMVREGLERGKVDLTLSFTPNLEASHLAGGETFTVNIGYAKALLEAGNLLSKETGLENNLKLDGLLRWPGVLTSAEPDQNELILLAKEALKEALLELQKSRAREGDKLVAQIHQRLAQISSLIIQAKEVSPRVLVQMRAQLLSKIASLAEDLKLQKEAGEARLEQELLFYAQRMDVSEELDRLEIHVSEANRLLNQPGSIGRRFDFLLQEFNREANTLGSKSSDATLTRIALDLKVLIEQIREQIQNIE